MRPRRVVHVDRLVVDGADRFDRARFERALRDAFEGGSAARPGSAPVEERAAREVVRRARENGT
jgi:hypothetical protein